MARSATFQPPRAEHPFAQFVRILGKGRTGTRSLEEAEAREAFGMILRGEVEPLQLGAFLMSKNTLSTSSTCALEILYQPLSLAP